MAMKDIMMPVIPPARVTFSTRRKAFRKGWEISQSRKADKLNAMQQEKMWTEKKNSPLSVNLPTISNMRVTSSIKNMKQITKADRRVQRKKIVVTMTQIAI